jgi:soluble epoxide hydrolase/lipid-phosphate phosphatase
MLHAISLAPSHSYKVTSTHLEASLSLVFQTSLTCIPQSSLNNMVDKITPDDSRVQYKTANLNGVTYSYILAEPKGQPLSTVFLVHGWPDLSLGWRYQVPLLVSLGLRVVVPDMMGYGGTDAPESPTFYTYKRASDDLAELAKQIGASSIILGGHDWGGAVVYRFALRYPKLVSAVISVCTPFAPPRKDFIDATVLPNFKYQVSRFRSLSLK